WDPWAFGLRTSAQSQDGPRDEVVVESLRSDLVLVAELHESSGELNGRGPGQDLTRVGRMLQSCSRVDLRADHDVAIGRRSDRHGAGVDADPDLHREGEVELRAESFGPVAHRPRGTDRAHRVVVARHRDAEDAQD